jgi:hypothetical protein
MTEEMNKPEHHVTSFTLNTPENPCPYWPTERHVIPPSGLCRCGKEFQVFETTKKEDTSADQA